jgi:spore coat polysaccharide biosynthesis protein SpsF
MISNEQQAFWKEKYAEAYIDKNSKYDLAGGVKCWAKMLERTQGINSILECGCNIGRNINFLNHIQPTASKSIIEISPRAFEIVTGTYQLEEAFNGSIVDSNFSRQFDLVYTMGVLIHIHPDDLLENMRKMYSYSSRYILMGEYFNRTPVMIEYQGQQNKLFKRDFGKLFIENFNVELVDYGFLWGHLYDAAGFDDCTYWLFSKK